MYRRARWPSAAAPACPAAAVGSRPASRTGAAGRAASATWDAAPDASARSGRGRRRDGRLPAHDGPRADPFDYFVRLADAFLHGRLYLLEAPSWLNELVPGGGGWYVVYPPVPAVLLVPFVAVFGTELPAERRVVPVRRRHGRAGLAAVRPVRADRSRAAAPDRGVRLRDGVLVRRRGRLGVVPRPRRAR